MNRITARNYPDWTEVYAEDDLSRRKENEAMSKHRKIYEVIGYVYEDDVHCLECSQRRFTDTRKFTLDNKEVCPVFLVEVSDYLTCSDCYGRIN